MQVVLDSGVAYIKKAFDAVVHIVPESGVVYAEMVLDGGVVATALLPAKIASY